MSKAKTAKRKATKATGPAKKAAKRAAGAREAKPKKRTAAGAKKAAAKKKPAARAGAKTKAPAKKSRPAKVANQALAAKAKDGKTKPIARRDGTGHLNPRYAATLREQSGNDPKENDRAFLTRSRTGDDLAEELGEEAVSTMTSGEEQGEESLNEATVEEQGGPFVETTAGTEFGYEADASNPKGAKREPFPTT
jgi:hypothetical protein